MSIRTIMSMYMTRNIHTAKDDEHGQAEADIALDTGGGLDVVGALDAGADQRYQDVVKDRLH